MAEHIQGTIFGEDVKIPSSWKNMPKRFHTRTELKAALKYEPIPDMSYDIDGDGSVGNRDYVLSIYLTAIGS